MASNHPIVEFVFETSPGVLQQVPAGVTVKARVDGAGSDLATYTTNALGQVESGAVSPASGTIIHFRIENYLGMATSVAVRTT